MVERMKGNQGKGYVYVCVCVCIYIMISDFRFICNFTIWNTLSRSTALRCRPGTVCELCTYDNLTVCVIK